MCLYGIGGGRRSSAAKRWPADVKSRRRRRRAWYNRVQTELEPSLLLLNQQQTERRRILRTDFLRQRWQWVWGGRVAAWQQSPLINAAKTHEEYVCKQVRIHCNIHWARCPWLSSSSLLSSNRSIIQLSPTRSQCSKCCKRCSSQWGEPNLILKSPFTQD
jgi:hypothetical protein